MEQESTTNVESNESIEAVTPVEAGAEQHLISTITSSRTESVEPEQNNSLPSSSTGRQQSHSGTASGRDSTWLELEVCREYLRGDCSRSAEECRFAHPTGSVIVKDGRVTCCFDNLKVWMTNNIYSCYHWLLCNVYTQESISLSVVHMCISTVWIRVGFRGCSLYVRSYQYSAYTSQHMTAIIGSAIWLLLHT